MKPLFAGDSEKLERTIGRLAIGWAMAESILDMCVSYAHFAIHQGEPDPKDELPMNARAKVRYFRRTFKKLLPRQDDQPLVDELADELLRLLDLRHWCIHGMVQKYQDDSALTFRRLKRPDLRSHEHKTVMMQDIDYTALDCLVLAVNLMNFMCEPVGAITFDQMKELYGRIGIEVPL